MVCADGFKADASTRRCKLLEKKSPCDGATVTVGELGQKETLRHSDRTLVTTKIVHVGPGKGKDGLSEKSLAIKIPDTSYKSMVAKLTPLESTTQQDLKKGTKMKVPATTGNYSLDLLYDGKSCMLISPFSIGCETIYEQQGRTCTTSCASQNKRAIGPEGQCARPNAEVAITSQEVSRVLYKPSKGLMLLSNASVEIGAKIHLKAAEEFAFEWSSVLQMLDEKSGNRSNLLRHAPLSAAIVALGKTKVL